MPILLLFGFLIYGLWKAAIWLICLPFRLIGWLCVGGYYLFGGIFSVIGSIFSGVGDVLSLALEALFDGDGSVIAAKLLTVVGIIGGIIYLIVKHA